MYEDADPYAQLARVAGDVWTVGRDLHMLTAYKRSADGRRRHYLVAPTARELANKIAKAEERDK